MLTASQTAWGGEWRLHWVEAQLEADLDTREISVLPSCGNLGLVRCQELEHLSESTLGNGKLALRTDKERSPLSV